MIPRFSVVVGTPCVVVLALLCLFAWAAPQPVHAQSADWSATLVVQPYPSPFLADWERNPQTGTLTVLYSGQAAQDYQVEATVRSGMRGVLGRVISPPSSIPFGPTSFFMNVRDLLSWQTVESNQRYVDLALQAGVIPEDDFSVCARIVSLDGELLAEACDEFSIALLDPPQLLFPAQEAVVTSRQPTFQWMPVVVPPEVGAGYRLRIVERYPQQTPSVALNANLPHYTETVSSPLHVYPLNGLEFEEGKSYAWRVDVVDVLGNSLITNDGGREIRTFTVDGSSAQPPVVAGGELPDTLPLIPGLARITGIRDAEIEETSFSYVLNGWIDLELQTATGARLTVQARDLEVDKQTLAAPVYRSGSLWTELESAFLANDLPDHVRATELIYTPERGIQLGAELDIPAGRPVPLSGQLQLTPGGLSGTLRAEGGGTALAEIGDDPLEVALTEAELRLPGGEVRIGGRIDLFGVDIGCDEVVGVISAAGELALDASCSPTSSVPLVPGLEGARLAVDMISGSVEADLGAASTSLSYQIEAPAHLQLTPDGACGASVLLALEDGIVRHRDFTPRCGSGSGIASLGWLELGMGGLMLDRFGYTPGSGFDFGMTLDLYPAVPSIPGLDLPALEGVAVGPGGLTIPATGAAIQGGALELAGFAVRASRVELPAFTLSWTDWQDRSADGFRFALELDAGMPELPSGTGACLSTGFFEARTATLADGLLSVELADHAFDPACTLPLAPGIAPGLALAVEGLGGTMSVRVAAEPVLETLPYVNGSLTLPSSFTCGDGASRSVSLGDARLRLGPEGGVVGRVTGLAPDCPLRFGGVDVRLQSADLRLDLDVGQQSAVLAGDANATFAAAGQPIQGAGRLTVDLMDGRILSGSVAFSGPFRFDLPAEEPLFSFRVQQATLDTAGLGIDGRHTLLLPGGDEIAATFDRLVLGREEDGVESGSVYFDTPFALEVGVDASQEMTWALAAESAPIGVSSGLRVDLPAGVSIGPDGVAASGSTAVHFLFGGREFPDATALFSQDFALGIDPVAVTRGVLDVRVDGVQIARIDPSGFQPSLTYLAQQLVPGTLPLPTADVGYLVLRDGGTSDGALLVQTMDTTGGTRIYTESNQTLSLVVPSLQLGRSAAPTLEVQLDVTIDDLSGDIVSGDIIAHVPAGQADAFDLTAAGLPFAVDTVAYYSAGPGTLVLAGRLKLFGETQGGPGSVHLAVDGLGNLTGAVSLALDRSLQLVPASDQLQLRLDSIDGTFDAALLGSTLDYTLDVDAGLELAIRPDSIYRAGAVLRATERGVTLQNVSLPVDDQQVGPTSADPPPLDLGVVVLDLDDMTVPVLEYDRLTGEWDFELVFDAMLEFPDMGDARVGPVQGIALTPTGFAIPAVSVPNITADPVQVAGYGLDPLAFRMSALAFDWFAGTIPADWGFGFDLGLSFPQLPQQYPAALRSLELTVLDAGYDGGVLTGTIEARTFDPEIQLVLNSNGMAVDLSELGGSLGAAADGSQEITVTLGGGFIWPASMQCGATGSESFALPQATLTLWPSGAINGSVTDVVPSCPLEYGPLALEVTGSDLHFGVSSDVQRVEMDLDGAVRLPGPTVGDTVRAAGSLAMDLVEGEVLSGAISVTAPFRWGLPADDPLLDFIVNGAQLDSSGLTLTGGGTLEVGDGPNETVGVAFNSLTLGLPDFGIRSGSVGFMSSFALEAGISGGNLSWEVQPGDGSRRDTTAAGLLVTVPSSAVLDSSGLALSGTAGAQLDFAGEQLASLDVEFLNGFRLGFDPAEITTGRASFVYNSTEVAFADAQGFHPGNFFGVLPIPGTLGLPSTDVAYLVLRQGGQDNGTVLLQTASTSAGLRLFTAEGESVRLAVPALAGQGGGPEIDVELDITVDPATYAVVAGSVEAQAGTDAAGLFGLEGLGLPLQVRRVAYSDAQHTDYTFVVDARVDLPESIASDLELDFENLEVTSAGLTGTARLTGNGGPVASADLEYLTLAIDSAIATFGASPDLELSGAATTALFAPATGAPTAIGFAASVNASNGFDFVIDDSALPTLPIGSATFDLQDIGQHGAVEFTATDSEFMIRFGGVLGMPSVSDDFAVTIDGLEVGTGGVAFPTMALSSGTQQFSLFSATFTLKDVGNYPGLAFGYDPDAQLLSVEMSGDLTFLDNTSTFHGFTVTSAGDFDVAGGTLLSSPVTLVSNVLTLDTLAIESNKLRADLGVELPAPFDQTGKQTAIFRVGADGTIDGGGVIVALDEPQAMDDDATEFELSPLATADPRYIGLDLDLDRVQENSAVVLVADLYLDGDEQNLIQLGTGSGAPGLMIGFDGSVQWGNIAAPNPFEFDFDVVRLDVNQVSAPATDAFGIDLDANFSLATEAVSSDLRVTSLELTTVGGLDFANANITGGSLTIADVVSMQVNGLDYSDSPATIWVPAQAAGSSAPTDVDSVEVNVASYLDFGGDIDVAGVFSGGVKRFLTYTAQDGTLTLLVDSAAASIDGAVDLRADLLYRESNGDFQMTLAGDATIKDEFTLKAVGGLGMNGSELNTGLFFIATAPIPIIPGVVELSEIGGGFFYNITPAQMDLVKDAARVSSSAASKVNDVQSGSTTWAAFLYGAASIVRPEVASGRVLVTVTNQKFALNGAVDVMCIGSAPCEGSGLAAGEIDLTVGWEPSTYMDGNVAVTVGYSPLVSGSAGTRFFIYGQDEWGVMGNADLSLVQFLTGSGDFFVGPPGFMASADISKSFDFWIIAVSSGFGAELWYIEDPGEFGAYMNIYLAASVLGGAVEARGDMYAALIAGNSFYIYGAAALSVDYTLGSWEGGVWAKFKDGGVDGGFGSDPEMERIVDRARQAAQDMTDAKNEAVAQLQENLPPGGFLQLSDAELAAIHDRLAGLPDAEFDALYKQGRDLATGPITYQDNGQQESVAAPSIPDSYLDWYRDVLRQADATTLDSAQLAVYADTVQARIDRLNQAEAEVRSQLSALRGQVDELRSMADTAFSMSSPVRSASLDAEPVRDQNGQLIGGPTFDVDQQAAQAAQAQLAAYEQAAQDLDRQVRMRIDAVETALTDLRGTLTATGDGSLLAYARLQARAVEGAERHFGEQANAVLERQDWARDQHAQLTTQELAVENVIDQRIGAARSQAGLNNRPVARQVADAQVGILGAWSADSNLLGDYELSTENLSAASLWDQAEISSKQIWYGVADAGLHAIDTAAVTILGEIDYAADQRLGGLRDRHQRFSREIDRLFLAHAEMTGALYDLYDQYLYWHSDTTVTLAESAEVTAMLDQAATRKQELAEELQVPDAGNVLVQVTPIRPFLSRVQFLWSGSHPSGIDEVRYADVPGGDRAVVMTGENLYSLGAPISSFASIARSWHYPDNPGQATEDRAVRAGVRGGAGFIGMRSTDYTLSFAGSSGDPVGSTETYLSGTDTTPPTTPAVWYPNAGRSIAGAEPWSNPAWVSDSTELKVAWSATDDESGVAGYRYAFLEDGSAADTVAVVGGRTSTLLEDLNLSASRAYGVTVWAQNGDGVWSDPGTSYDLRYDPTAPVFPVGGALERWQPAGGLLASYGGYGTAYFTGVMFGSGSGNPYASLNNDATPACAVSEPAYPGAPLVAAAMPLIASSPVLGADTPRITLQRPDASDSESGVANYFWHAGPAPAPTFAGDHRGATGWHGWASTEDTLTLEGAPLNFTDSIYITLVAVNYAGAASEPLVYGPFQLPDDSPPTEPDFCGRMGGNDRVTVRVDKRSVDGESGVVGYSYRLRGTGTSVLRAWPDSVDWTGVQAGSYRSIESASFSDGSEYYIDVRAVNGQGDRSTISASGPITYDASPPPEPSATGSIGASSVSIDIDPADDPHSGLMTVQYAVYSGPTPVIGWTSHAPPTDASAFSISRSRPMSTFGSVCPTLTLKVRSVNGVGDPSTIYTTKIRSDDPACGSRNTYDFSNPQNPVPDFP